MNNNAPAKSESANGEKKIQFIEIIKESFLLTWKNKFLWVFGFLILLGSLSANTDLFNEKSGNSSVVSLFFQNHPVLFVLIILVSIVLFIFLLLLRITSTAALIKSINNPVLYSQLKIRAILKEAKTYLWKLLLLEVLIGLATVFVAVVILSPVAYLFFLKAKIFASVALVAAIAILIPLFVLAYFVRRFASFFVVLGNLEIRMAAESAYSVFSKNIKDSLKLGAINLAMSFGLMIAIPVLAVLILLILAIPTWVLYLIFSKVALWVCLILGGVAMTVLILVLLSWFVSFMQALWLLFFQQISFVKSGEKEAVEEIELKGKVSSPEVV